VVPICGRGGCWWKKWLCGGGVVAGDGFGYAVVEVVTSEGFSYAVVEVVAGEGFDPTELPIFAPTDEERRGCIVAW
jgi:hypothetical protein